MPMVMTARNLVTDNLWSRSVLYERFASSVSRLPCKGESPYRVSVLSYESDDKIGRW